MKRILMVLIMVVASFVSNAQCGEYNVQFKGFDDYNGLDVIFQFLNIEDMKSPFTKDEGTTVKDGKFSLQGTISEPQDAVFVIKKGGRFVTLEKFLIEPGNLTIEAHHEGVKVIGGKYNDIVVNSWKWSPRYIELWNKQRSYYKEGMSREELAEAREKATVISADIKKVTLQKLRNIIATSKDPYVKALALNYGGFLGEDREFTLKVLTEIETEHGPTLVTRLLRMADEKKQLHMAAKKVMGEGKQIKDFTTTTFQGQEINLSNVLAKNKLVFVEFWASWCGPCRDEIPNMKRAYEKYHEKGFEIFSFSLDTKKERWVKATNEEQIPWINTSDLKAHKSPVVKMFGVSSIPANYLVDSDGKIIAVDLRGEKLQEKLNELLK